MNPNVIHLECSLEGRIYPAGPVYRLSDAGRPLLVRYHLDRIAQSVDRDELAVAEPRIAYIEEDAEVYLSQWQNNAPWGLDRLDQRDLPLDGRFFGANTASNVRAYIIDSGIRASHT